MFFNILALSFRRSDLGTNLTIRWGPILKTYFDRTLKCYFGDNFLVKNIITVGIQTLDNGIFLFRTYLFG